MRKRITTTNHWYNCLLPMIILLLKDRIKAVIYISKKRHWAGLTHKGNLIHFKTTTRKDLLAPVVFEGYLEMIGKYRYSRNPIFTSVWQIIGYILYGSKAKLRGSQQEIEANRI
jgi:hypothetical protein